jgi:hypothetical protein
VDFCPSKTMAIFNLQQKLDFFKVVGHNPETKAISEIFHLSETGTLVCK